MNKMQSVFKQNVSGSSWDLLLDEGGGFGPQEQDGQDTNQHMGYQSQEMVIKHFEQNPDDSCATYHYSRGLLIFP